jgi:hypothetical protein
MPKKTKKPSKAEQTLQQIYDILYLDEDDVYNPDKEWEGADCLQDIAAALDRWKPRPE